MRHRLISGGIFILALVGVLSLAGVLGQGGVHAQAIDVDPAGAADTVEASELFCDRTAPVRDAIVAMVVNADTCSEVKQKHLEALDGRLTFDLSAVDDDGVMVDHTIADGDLDDLISLTGLAFIPNGQTLPADVFDELDSLENLDLAGGSLRTLPAGVFDGVDTLESLDLGGNPLTALEESLFEDLTVLTDLDLISTQLTTVPERLLEHQSSLRSVDLSHNVRLASVPGLLFKGATSLEEISLEYNVLLTELPSGLFNGLVKLERLRLGGSGLTAIDSDAFDGLTKLELLDLSGNDIHSMPAGLLIGLVNLVTVDFSNNPGTPFPITFGVRVASVDDSHAKVVVEAEHGMPDEVEVALSSAEVTFTPQSAVLGPGIAASPELVALRPKDVKQVSYSISTAGWVNPVGDGGSETAKGFVVASVDPVDLVWNDPAQGLPGITGSAQVGSTLSAVVTGITDVDVSDMSRVEFSYQWLSGGSVIEGATSSQYRVVSGDVGRTIKVRVSFPNQLGSFIYYEVLVSGETTEVVEGGL